MNRKQIISYNSNLKELARQLRKNSTLSEALLWQHLKGKQMLGYNFDRQKPVDTKEFISKTTSYANVVIIRLDRIIQSSSGFPDRVGE